jgi:nucleoid-associated protein YgaU
MEAGKPGAKRRVLGIALTLLLLGGLYVLASRTIAPEPDADAPGPELAGTPEAAPEPASETPAEATPEAPADVGAAPAPSFDLVRVEPDGSAAVAGTAAPNATVTIYADAAPLAEVEADAQGNFVAIFDVEPSAEPRSLTLGTLGPDGTEAHSTDVVMLLPEAPSAPAPEVAPQPETTASATTAPELAASEPAAAESAALDPAAPEAAEPETVDTEPAAEPEVAATALIREDEVEVMPPAGDPAADRRVTLASISYAEAGDVTLAGVGTAGAVIRAYVDDRFASEGRVADDGRWRMALGDVAKGLYTLRIDQIAPDGRVASRIETPFQRDFPEPPPPRPQVPPVVELGPGTSSVTVQPGHNLWTLARQRYGSGVMYTQILTANRELIRDPDLIYPGQIFNLPDAAAQ